MMTLMNIQTFTIVSGKAVCNASCPYCVSKMTGLNEVIIKEKQINFRNFKKACRLAQISGVSTVLITGKGEPVLYPEQITNYLDHLQEYNFPLIELQTNGLLLIQKKYDRFLKKWLDLGLGLIAISIVHYDRKKNQQIYTPGKDYPDLKELVKKLHKLDFSVRFSVTMSLGLIDSPEEVEKIVWFAKDLEVEQLSFRPVAKPKLSESAKVTAWVKEHEIPTGRLQAIIEFLEKKGHRLITYGHGAVLYDLDGQNVCLTDALTIRPETENIRQLIFFPDGHLRFDWQYKGAVLL